jgi:4-alpha-glucanotransferase
MQNGSPLHRLADRVGILPEYIDQSGRETRTTTDETRVAILDAMGIDASTPALAEQALAELQRSARERLLAPARVAAASDGDAGRVAVRLGSGVGWPVEWSLEFTPEEGEAYRLDGTAEPDADGVVILPLRETPVEGYHRVRVAVSGAGGERHAEQSLIVVPDACPSVRDLTGRDRVFGVTANLYTVRSAANWGVGDLSDLGRLLEWTAGAGGAFVGINPLHALRNRGNDVSPYSPVSRVFRNAIYLDIGAVPEWEEADEARRLLEGDGVRSQLDALRATDRIEYERIMGLKRQALEALHRAFLARHAGGETARGGEFRAYVESQGEPLRRFATFEALADEIGTDWWYGWPEPYRDPRSEAVEDFAAARPDALGFHAWVQFEIDRQLAAAAERGRRAGIPIGLYQDLAIGTSPNGSDIWANPQLFLRGVSIGAPPDDYSATGQNWGLPPLDPRALREDGYRYWIRLLRATMRGAGALRIDHAMGLFRQFWIPHGMDGGRGAYVRFPADELLGILALEAHRHRALVVGEDLGTVPPEVPPALHRRGILSSRVFYFERDGSRFRAAAEYEPMALATANTHDMPTLAGFWRGRDIELRHRIGLADGDAARDQARARADDRRSVLERLAAEGVLPTAEEPASGAELRGAVHDFLCRTPSALVGFSLDDLVGEPEPVNLPGVPAEQFSAWTRKLATPVEALADDPDVRAAMRCGGRGVES